VNAKLNPTENAHIMVFYGKHLRLLQISSLFLAVLCAVIAYASSWSDETLGWLSLPLMIGYAVGEEVMWIRLERFARGSSA
jgi:EamA domain-containing membrane protein RarD